MKKGFTLIELLVVIAIIGLLATFSVVGFTTSKEKARLAGGASFSRSLYNAQSAEAVGVWNLDEGTGTTVYNRSGTNSNTGTITGATWITDGPNGKPAIQFSAAGHNINLGSITLPVRVTVTAWIRTSMSSQLPFFSNRGNGLFFGINSGHLFMYYNTATPAAANSIAYINDNKWHHVAWSSDGATSIMYIDGKKETPYAQTRPAETGNAYIGYDAPNGTYFNGSVADFAIYSDVVTSKGIEQMYAEGVQKYLAVE